MADKKKKPSIVDMIGAQVGDVSIAALDAGAKMSESDTQPGREQIEYIPRTSLVADTRNFYSMTGIDELARNIETVGLLDPLRVRPMKGEEGLYRVVSGHRRRAALDRLALDGNKSFEMVPVIIERAEGVSEAMEELRLIFANNDTRRLSSADLARQAERVEALLYQLKKEGMEFTGRMRAHVAEICKVKETKLAMIKAIQSNIKVPGLIEAWKRDELNESVAYEISKMPMVSQYRLLDWHIDNHVSFSEITARDIKRLDVIFTCTPRECPRASGRKPCANGERMYNSFYRNGEWNCAGCCAQCNKRETCHACCSFCKPQEAPKDAPTVAKNPALDDPRADWSWSRDHFCARLKKLRTATGMDKKTFAESIGDYPNTYSAWENASLPGSDRLVRLALCLDTSLDYLFGLTDDPRRAGSASESGAPLVDTAPAWSTEAPEAEGWYYCQDGEGWLNTYYWFDGKWYPSQRHTPTAALVKDLPVRWHRLPEGA